MGEFITVQVGQCGNQIGQAFWPSVLKEYGLMSNGNVPGKVSSETSYDSLFYNPSGVAYTSLDEMRRYNIKARALLVDMEDSVVERFQTSSLRYLFDRACTLSSYPGSGNNWAVGHFTHGREQEETFLNMLQSSVEKCDALSGFLSLFSLGGGTGSGLGSAIVELLHDQYPRINRLVCCVHPGENQDVVTAPYNIALCLSVLKEYASCVIPVDNQVLLQTSSRLHTNKEMRLWKPYRNVNTIIVKLLLNTTSGVRFPGSSTFEMRDLSTNLVPYPGLHFLASCMSPISLVNEEDTPVNQRITNLLTDACSKHNQLMSVNPLKEVNSVCLMARGDVSQPVLSSYSLKLRERIKWVSWSNQDMLIYSCPKAPYDHPRSLTCLSNTDLMGHFFEDTLKKFFRLYRKRAHCHHYTNVDGFEDSFERCIENLCYIVDSYKENRTLVSIPRLNIVR